MKLALLSSLILLSACGKYELPSTGRVGALRPLEQQVVAADERRVLNSLCSGLVQKQDRLNVGILPSTVFTVSQRACGATEMSEGVEVPVQVQRVSSEISEPTYKFVRTGGADFIFPEVETASSPSFYKIICNPKEPHFTMPLRSGSGEYIWVRTADIPGSECSPGPDGVCIVIERALGEEGTTQARIHAVETIRFKTRDPVIGFYTEKRVISKNFCAENQTTETRAVLRF